MKGDTDYILKSASVFLGIILINTLWPESVAHCGSCFFIIQVCNGSDKPIIKLANNNFILCEIGAYFN